VTLKAARTKAEEARELVAEGNHPPPTSDARPRDERRRSFRDAANFVIDRDRKK